MGSPETNVTLSSQPPSTTNSNPSQNRTTINFLNIQEDNHNHQEFPGNNNQEEKETMFEKALSQTDLGSRLVSPKHDAEMYLPHIVNENELQLEFEDEGGRSWIFPYVRQNGTCYLRRGWLTFVREKNLKEQDVVVFQRHRLDGQKRFIMFRRRGDPPAQGGAAVAAAAPDRYEYEQQQFIPPSRRDIENRRSR